VRTHTPGGDPDAEERLYAGLRTPILWPAGISLHGWLEARTRFFDEATLTAIQSGVAQIVIVGAGYDGRALRFRQAGVRFFEVDHPATQGDKRHRVEQLGAEVAETTYVAHDLTQGDLAEALAAAGHVADQPSLFICEGLLLYLDMPVAEELLRTLLSRAGVGSRLALSAHELEPDAGPVGRVRMAGQRALLAAIREPRRSLFAPGELTALLKRSGWEPTDEQARTSGGRRGMLVLSEPRAAVVA
jgi:methyltransferase (TIGR00027 family)